MLNAVVQISTIYGDQTSAAGGPTDAQTLVGSAILTIPEASTITLRNVGATADILVTTIDGATIVNASIRLVKIS